MSRLNAFDWGAVTLSIIGALNWGLVGAFQFDLVGAIFGDMTALSRLIYIIVGLAGIYLILTVIKMAQSD